MTHLGGLGAGWLCQWWVWEVGEGDGGGYVGGDGGGFIGCGFDVADDVDGLGDDGEAAGVGGGEAQAVEEDAGAGGVEQLGGDGVDDLGDGELDGLAVFEGGEGDHLAAGDAGGAAGEGLSVDLVGAVEAVVEVAEVVVGEGDGAALGSVGLDVAAELDLHGGSFG